MDSDIKIAIFVIFISLVVGILVGISVMYAGQKPEIQKDKYCFWVEYSSAQEDLLISQGKLLKIYNSYYDPAISEKWDNLKEEMKYCGEKS